MFDVKLFTIRSLIKPGSSDDAGRRKHESGKLFSSGDFLIEIKSLTTCWCIIPKKMHLIKKVLENININFISEIKSKTWKPI